ncbi:hypothetical protein [Halosolutus gelatinilyticus]|uniref:hypothetical protein n=1 Tax=Halosolutus gelatinilyticus TaxID=2931975 RepID=UPI001FF60B40|nr:hypothetical protein [Halosolutus gelatinilyticus]
MTATGDQRDGARPETIELPATEATQRALHEATGHLYDELAVAAEETASEREQLPDAVFEAIESLYVATAEESVSRVEISYERID